MQYEDSKMCEMWYMRCKLGNVWCHVWYAISDMLSVRYVVWDVRNVLCEMSETCCKRCKKCEKCEICKMLRCVNYVQWDVQNVLCEMCEI